MRGDGDGWAIGPDGDRHWGKHGAAGLLLRAPLPDRTAAVLLQHRAAWSHEGGTWALPGGARDSHESATGAAVREAHEEAGIDDASLTVRTELVTMAVPHVWSYTTVVADTSTRLATVPNRESLELRWVPEADVTALPLHSGFAASWPRLRALDVHLVVDPDIAHAAELPRTVVLPDDGFGWVTRIDTAAPASLLDRSALLDRTAPSERPEDDPVLVVVSENAADLARLPSSVFTLSPSLLVG
ncbi:NUDIX hydrolase [Rhodococcus sp. HNM0569]|uniref:NUDIX hydrolase n=1 Tax=Rhodococcus sp. HNM0569 TaxID=2716340 RepID=UPI00146DDFAD|nr:NUDIX hydrolase [Rhodococcus sp. HNM0569]NLU83163.1 NUDIX hydrolase [Rhodococcus sp. HNM0569]